MLTLYEELLLLTIHEAKGILIHTTLEKMKPGLAGAILAELALECAIQTTPNHRLQPCEEGSTTVPLMDDVLATMRSPAKEHKFSYWITSLSHSAEKLRKQTIDGLFEKGILTPDDDRLRWVIPSPIAPEVKASPKYVLIQRLRRAALAAEDIQPRDIILLSLLKACGLLELVFFRDERKLAARSMNELLFSQAFKDPVIQTIQEIEAVVAEMVEED